MKQIAYNWICMWFKKIARHIITWYCVVKLHNKKEICNGNDSDGHIGIYQHAVEMAEMVKYIKNLEGYLIPLTLL